MRNPFRKPSIVGALAKWLLLGVVTAGALLAIVVVVGNLTDDDFGPAKASAATSRFEEPAPVALVNPAPPPTVPTVEPAPAPIEAPPRPKARVQRKPSAAAGIIRSAPF